MNGIVCETILKSRAAFMAEYPCKDIPENRRSGDAGYF